MNAPRPGAAPPRSGGPSARLPSRFVLLPAFALVAIDPACAGVPSLDGLFPAAVQAGTTNDIALVGKFDPWPVMVWAGEGAGIRWLAQTNSGVVRVEVSRDAAPGPHLVRVFNAEGASAVRFLVVDPGPQVLEAEPNDAFLKPQAVASLPVSINARFEKSGDVDSYAVKLKAGETLVASLEGYVLQSPFDGVLRVLNDRHVQVAWNHDDGLSLDPRVAWVAPQEGAYVVQAFGFDHPANSDVRLCGNAKCIYRLRLTAGTAAHHALPLGVQRGVRTSLRLFGWGSATNALRTVEVDGASIAPGQTMVTATWPGMSERLALPVGEGPELVERESGGNVGEGESVPVPGAVSGAVGVAGDEDRFVFSARKDERFVFEVASASLGFALDAWLRLEDSARKEITRSDDTDSADPRIEWTAPADGSYGLVVGSLVRRGGPDYVYRLSLAHPQPTLVAKLSADVFTVEAGRTNEVKVGITRRHGFLGRLSVIAEGLPAGVVAEPVDVPEKDGEVVLKLRADTSAKPASVPFRVMVRDKEKGRDQAALFELAGTGENNGVPQGFRRLVIMAHEWPWLTVLPPPPPPASKEPDKKP